MGWRQKKRKRGLAGNRNTLVLTYNQCRIKTCSKSRWDLKGNTCPSNVQVTRCDDHKKVVCVLHIKVIMLSPHLHPAQLQSVLMPHIRQRRALWSQTTRKMHIANFSNVIWPCNANRNEHAGRKQLHASQHTKLFEVKNSSRTNISGLLKQGMYSSYDARLSPTRVQQLSMILPDARIY